MTLDGGVLGGWQDRNRRATLPHLTTQLNLSDSLHNLRRLLDPGLGGRRGSYPFLDSDLYKVLESLAYELGSGRAGSDARAFWDASTGLLEAVQRPDGYLNSFVQDSTTGPRAWDDLAWGHELYCLGHLIQAGIAESRQLGETRLLAVARRFADCAVLEFGPDGREGMCGHPEVEMALVELYRLTGQQSYLDTATAMVARRGRGRLRTARFGPEYFVDHRPLRELDGVTGHAVRMVYLAAGATDVAAETGDGALLAALETLWDDMVATRLYITGGLGSRHADEAIGDRYELPSERAYAETCAAIGTLQWAWRLFLATGRADILDVMETLQHNAFAAATSVDGRAFLYDNPLQRRPDHAQQTGGELDGSALRRGWFACACCPPNLARWTSQLQDHVAAADKATLFLAHYANGTVDDGQVGLRVTTDYPWGGVVHLRVERASAEERTLALRLPVWCPTFSVVGPDDVTADHLEVRRGWILITRRWEVGEELSLSLAMPVRLLSSHPHVDATRGAVAVARGPIVFCAEQVDHEVPVDDLVLLTAEPIDVEVARRANLGEHPVDHVVVTLAARTRPPANAALYPPVGSAATMGEPATATLVPYALWGNRCPGAMRVWLRQS